MRMPSVMGHKFSEVPRAEIPRSRFDRSFGYKTTFDAGYLVPFYVDEVLPGDTFQMSATLFGRLATPLKPVMDNMFLETFFFFVPNRLVWSNWERFQGQQDNPDDPTDYLVPYVSLGVGVGTVGSLWDYLGMPITLSGTIFPNALHSRAYNLIWNTWFRDQNLQDSQVVDMDDGPDDPSDYGLLRRGKRHDYFTSCLPWPQKGDSVLLPLGEQAPIAADGTTPQTLSFLRNGTTETAMGTPAGGVLQIGNAVTAIPLYADLSNATSASINTIRQAFQVQRILERDARGGTRYIEAVKARFGVTSPDARLQRPEYLGGGSSRVNITPVPQTSGQTTPVANDAQGNLAGYGTVSGSGHGFTKSFTEHGVLIGLVCVRADLTYQQGLDRMWRRRTRFDFYEPALSHLGEQAVLKEEIYCRGAATDDDVFGYQERFAEYRYKPSKITGKFRSEASGSLDVWHLSQEFGSVPSLDETFIVEDPPIDRVIAVDTEPHFLLDAYCKLTCARPMPLYGVPGLIDHF